MAFPICSEPKFFAGSRFRIASLDGPTQAAIEKAQPYNRLKPGKWFMPLWWLSKLHDIDKHRSSHLTTVASHPDEIVTDAKAGTCRALWNRAAHVDGAPILWLTLTEPNPNVYVNLQATAAVVLDIEEIGRPIGVHPTMGHIRREVVTICRYLSGCFPA